MSREPVLYPRVKNRIKCCLYWKQNRNNMLHLRYSEKSKNIGISRFKPIDKNYAVQQVVCIYRVLKVEGDVSLNEIIKR